MVLIKNKMVFTCKYPIANAFFYEENNYNIKMPLHTFLLVAKKDICNKLMAKIN